MFVPRFLSSSRPVVDADESAPLDRYIALQNNAQREGPLKEYFKGETLHHSVDAEYGLSGLPVNCRILTTIRVCSLWTKNMYLAEDRILCWELVAKRGSAWVLHYQRSAYAVTVSPSLPYLHLSDMARHVFLTTDPLSFSAFAGRAGSGSRLDCPASSMAQRIVLCRDSLDLPLWLHLSVRPWLSDTLYRRLRGPSRH